MSPAVADPLEIHVNRRRPNVLEVPELFVADQDFAVEVVNAGKPVHIHLNLDDDLLEVLDMETGNHFVPREDTYRLPVRVRGDNRPVRGKLNVSTGYGAESRFIELRVVEPDEDERVTVDEQLAEPSGRAPQPTWSARIVSEVGVVALVVIALVALAVGATIVATLTTPVLGGLLAVAAMLIAVGVYLFL